MPCEAEREAERRAADPEKYHAASRDWQAARRIREPDAVRAETNRNVARYRRRHAERLAAERHEREASPEYRARYGRARYVKNLVQAAIRDGVLVRPTACAECGGPGPIEAAHASYDEPLVVRWLCRSCHRRWDAIEPKTRK